MYLSSPVLTVSPYPVHITASGKVVPCATLSLARQGHSKSPGIVRDAARAERIATIRERRAAVRASLLMADIALTLTQD